MMVFLFFHEKINVSIYTCDEHNPLEGFQAGKESGSLVVTPTGTLRAKYHIEIDGYS